MTEKYLYNCYCGLVRVREDEKDKHQGYLYENCPRVTAPKIKTPKISEISDSRIHAMYNNLDTYIEILKRFNITKAFFVGSFVRGDQTYKSNIEIVVYTENSEKKELDLLKETMNRLDSLSFDIIHSMDYLMMPHMSLDKGDKISLFDSLSNYVYNEQKEEQT